MGGVILICVRACVRACIGHCGVLAVMYMLACEGRLDPLLTVEVFRARLAGFIHRNHGAFVALPLLAESELRGSGYLQAGELLACALCFEVDFAVLHVHLPGSFMASITASFGHLAGDNIELEKLLQTSTQAGRTHLLVTDNSHFAVAPPGLVTLFSFIYFFFFFFSSIPSSFSIVTRRLLVPFAQSALVVCLRTRRRTPQPQPLSMGLRLRGPGHLFIRFEIPFSFFCFFSLSRLTFVARHAGV